MLRAIYLLQPYMEADVPLMQPSNASISRPVCTGAWLQVWLLPKLLGQSPRAQQLSEQSSSSPVSVIVASSH